METLIAWFSALAPQWLVGLLLELGVLFALTYGSFRVPRVSDRHLERFLLAAVFAPILYATAAKSGLLDEKLLRFARPWAVGVPTAAGLLVLYRLRRSAQDASRRQTLQVVALIAAALSLGLASAGLELGRQRDQLAVVVLVDQSRSVELVDNAEARIARELAVAEHGMEIDDRIAVLEFGSNAQLTMPLRRKRQPHSPQRASIGRDATDIGQAIRQGLLELPSDSWGKLVLVSDGLATRGDTFESVAAALAAEVSVDVLALEQKPLSNVRLVSLQGPSAVSDGEVFDLRVVVDSPSAQSLNLRVLQDDLLVRSGPVKVGAGQELVSLRQQAKGPGLRRYEVQLTAQRPELDQLTTDNRRSLFVKVRGATSALILSRDPLQNAPLEAALGSAAIAVTNVSFLSAPMSVSDLSGFDLVVLGDLPAHLFTPAQLGALAAQVRALGGGLLLLGSDQSMGPGGYARTAIEEVSPVSFDLKQDRRRGRLAQVIAIDYSGSMGAAVGAHSKLELANEAAVRSLSLLSSRDLLGVMHVDTKVHWTLPLGEVQEKAQLTSALRAVGPGGGGIYIDVSLRAAYQRLMSAQTNLKHVLLFADGSDAEERKDSISLARHALGQKITTSVIALGQGSDVAALEALSTAGGGRFYLIEDAARLPAVFAQETVLAARSSLNEATFSPVATTGGGVLRGIDFSNPPTLDGYVVTLPKPRAEVLIMGPERDPILATWSVGLGRAAAFTGDYSGRWSSRWTSWPGASQLFAQLGRSLARDVEDPNFRLKANAQGGGIEIEADLLGGAGFADSYRRLQAHVVGPDGLEHALLLNATGPGRYAATMPLERPGNYVVSARDLATNALLGLTGTELHPADELKPTGTDYGVLASIARDTGGQVRTSLEGLFEQRWGQRFNYRDLSLELLWVGALMLLLSVIARRFEPPAALLAYLGAIRSALELKRELPKAPPSPAGRLSQRQRNPEQDSVASAAAASARKPELVPPTQASTDRSSTQPAAAVAAPSSPALDPAQGQRTAAQVLLERRRKRARKP